MTITIGAFEAKTHLSSLLDRVTKGEDFLITKRGRPVARLVSEDAATPTRDVLLAKLKAARLPISTTAEEICDWIDEGRT
jgi:prevent-host-death family protein